MEEIENDPAGEAVPGIARPVRTNVVYAAEFKAKAVNDYLAVMDRMTRAEYARKIGVPAGTFDGWWWKATGVARGHARDASPRPAGQPPAAIDVTEAMRQAQSPGKTARMRICGVEVEAGADGVRMILEALRCLA